MFAVEHWGVRPDILVFAKGIASGMPLSGIAASKQLMSKQVYLGALGPFNSTGGSVGACEINSTIPPVNV